MSPPSLPVRADSTCADADLSRWMMNSGGETPCQVAESLVRVCAPTAQVQHLSTDVSCSSLGAPSNSTCCCSTVTYALVAACWVCQTSRPTVQLSTTYQAWLAGCPSVLNGLLPPVANTVSPPLAVPTWAFVQPSALNSIWNISLAQRAVGYIPPPASSASPAPTPSASNSPTPTAQPPKDPRPPTIHVAPIVIGSLAGLLVILFMAHWLYKRRNRISPSATPPPGFSLDDEPLQPASSHDEDGPGWMWWKRKTGHSNGTPSGSSSKRGGSDPGKIDAWHYPFAYTPVSVGSSGSPSRGCGVEGCASCAAGNVHGHGHGQYYDPYVGGSRATLRPPSADEDEGARRRSRDRRGRSSSETRLLPGRVSSDTLRPGSANTARGGPSPAPTRYSPVPPPPPPSGLVGYVTGPHINLSAAAIPPGYVAPQPTTVGYSHSHSGAVASPPFGTVPYSPPTWAGPSTSHGAPTPLFPPSHAQPSSSRIPTHTHTFEVQLSPTQYADLTSRYPEIQVRTRKHRHRRRDRNHGRSGDEGDDRGERNPGEARGERESRSGRPRSWSVPGPAQSDGQGAESVEDGRPRNGPELVEKYRRQRRRDGGRGLAQEEGEQERTSAKDREAVRTVEEPATKTRGSRSAIRELDGGVSLMGGPPRR